jgi:hypothetical protein
MTAPRKTLEKDPANANRGTDRGRKMVRDSLRDLGAGRSIVVDKHGTVIAGNKTLEAAEELGIPTRLVETDGSELVVVQRTDLDLGEGDKARKLAYSDNRSAQVGLDWDTAQVALDLAAGIDLSPWWEEGELLCMAECIDAMMAQGGEMEGDPLAEKSELWTVTIVVKDECAQSALLDALRQEGDNYQVKGHTHAYLYRDGRDARA